MSEKEIKCVECGTQTKEAKDITITPIIKGKKTVITGLTGSRCPKCGEQYVDADSVDKVERFLKSLKKSHNQAIYK